MNTQNMNFDTVAWKIYTQWKNEHFVTELQKIKYFLFI